MKHNGMMSIDLVVDPLTGNHLQGILIEGAARHDVRGQMTDCAARVLVNTLTAAGKYRINTVVDHVIENHRRVEHNLRGQGLGKVVKLHVATFAEDEEGSEGGKEVVAHLLPELVATS